MRIAGVDISTAAIDAVFLNLDDDRADWTRFTLAGPDLIDKVMSVREAFGPTWDGWDDVLAIGVERPIGRFNPGPLNMICGAVLTRIPAAKLVKLWTPPAWKKAALGKGNATKEDVATWVCDGKPCPPDKQWWPQDAFDAYCIVVATRNAIVTVPDTAPPTR